VFIFSFYFLILLSVLKRNWTVILLLHLLNSPKSFKTFFSLIKLIWQLLLTVHWLWLNRMNPI
jgi:DNA-binding HxlR family transcriptional regulator